MQNIIKVEKLAINKMALLSRIRIDEKRSDVNVRKI